MEEKKLKGEAPANIMSIDRDSKSLAGTNHLLPQK